MYIQQTINIEANDIAGLSEVAKSGNYSDLKNKPTKLSQFENDLGMGGGSNTGSTGGVNYVHPATHPADMITGLSQVATSGKYTDLTGRPTKLSDFTNDIEISSGNGSYILPIASSNTLGGIKVGNNLTIDNNGVLSAVIPNSNGSNNSYNDSVLVDKINKINQRETDKEVNVTAHGFQIGINANVEQNTSIIQSLINQYNDLVLYFPSGISKIGQLNLGSEKNITFRGKSSSFATSVNKSTSTPKVVDTYSQIFVNLGANAPWIKHQNCTIIFDKISVINGQIDSQSSIEYTKNNLMIETQTNELKGKVFAFDCSFIDWKSLGGDIGILDKEEDILQSCWLATRCRFRNNTIALAQLVDGRVTDCSFNKNEYAILMKKAVDFLLLWIIE